MSVPSATAAASTRPRKDSRASNPKARGLMTPKQSEVEDIEEFQRKRRSSSKSSNGCCLVCIVLCVIIGAIATLDPSITTMDTINEFLPG